MPITAQSIVQRATLIAQDVTSVRWSARELTRWLNDAQREVVMFRPDSTATAVVATPVPGTAATRQTLANMSGVVNPAKLIDVTRNMAASGSYRSVRLVSREIMDSQFPGWHAAAAAIDTIHFIFDNRDPLAFYLYPQPTAATRLEVIYAAFPTAIALPAEGVILTAALSDTDTSVVAGNVALPDTYANALLDYVLYRAYLKDSDYAGNVQRAQAHYAAFANSLGMDAKTLFAAGPVANAPGNPNVIPQA